MEHRRACSYFSSNLLMEMAWASSINPACLICASLSARFCDLCGTYSSVMCFRGNLYFSDKHFMEIDGILRWFGAILLLYLGPILINGEWGGADHERSQPGGGLPRLSLDSTARAAPSSLADGCPPSSSDRSRAAMQPGDAWVSGTTVPTPANPCADALHML